MVFVGGMLVTTCLPSVLLQQSCGAIPISWWVCIAHSVVMLSHYQRIAGMLHAEMQLLGAKHPEFIQNKQSQIEHLLTNEVPELEKVTMERDGRYRKAWWAGASANASTCTSTFWVITPLKMSSFVREVKVEAKAEVAGEPVLDVPAMESSPQRSDESGRRLERRKRRRLQ